METISTTLKPYKDILGTVASYVTIAQFFSGAFICNDIRKCAGTATVSSTPFIGGITVGLAMLKYGQLLNDDAMITVNIAAIVLNALYALFFYSYSANKWQEILKPLTIGMGFVAILWGYCGWEDPKLLNDRYGLIVTLMMLLLLGAPLADLKDIIRNKDSSSIPFVLTFMGTIVTFLWLLYAIVIDNSFMIVQNLIGFILCFMQLSLIVIYPSGTKTVEGKPTKNVKKE